MYKNIDSAIKYLDKEIERVYKLYDKAKKEYNKQSDYGKNPVDSTYREAVNEIIDQLGKLEIAKRKLEEANRLCVHTL